MTLLDHANAQVARLAGELDAEEAKIAAAIAAKTSGDGSGYWKRAHALRERHRVAVQIRNAIEEAVR